MSNISNDLLWLVTKNNYSALRRQYGTGKKNCISLSASPFSTRGQSTKAGSGLFGTGVGLTILSNKEVLVHTRNEDFSKPAEAFSSKKVRATSFTFPKEFVSRNKKDLSKFRPKSRKVALTLKRKLAKKEKTQ